MDRFESIIESLGSFLGAFMGLLMLGGIIAVIIIIIRNSKKPRYEQLKQQAYQQQAQQYNNPYGQGQPYPQQGQPYPQGQPYQQGQPYPQQGMPYPQGQPYPQGMPYPPPQPQNNNTAIKAVIIGLVLYFFVLPLIAVIVIMGMIFGMARSCDRDQQQLYDEAISASKLSVRAETPKTIEAGSTTLTKFLDSNYSFIGFAGDYLVLQNDAASHTSYGFRQGCRVLVDKEGELVTPDDEYYSTITLTDKLTYKGEPVIVCTDYHEGFYAPTGDESKFEDQLFLSLSGKKLKPDSLDYDSSDFKDDKYSCRVRDPDRQSGGDMKHTVDHEGTVGITGGENGAAAQDDEAIRKRDEMNAGSSFVIRDIDSSAIVFPKNAATKAVSESLGNGLMLTGELYTGDVYKDIYYYDLDAGYVCAARYYPDTGRTCLGLYDLDGSALYEYSPQYLTFDSHRAVMSDNDNVTLCTKSEEYVFFRTDTGYDAVDLKGNKKASITADDLTALTGELYYSKVGQGHMLGAISGGESPTEQALSKAENGIVVFRNSMTYTYYKQ